LDVTLGTLRLVFISKGAKHIAPIVGFVEIFIWVSVIAQMLSHANGFWSYFSYAAGYAVGTYIGLSLEIKIGFGYLILRVFTAKTGHDLVTTLNAANFGATMIEGYGAVSRVNIIETVFRRTSLSEVTRIIGDYDHNAFYTVEDVRTKQKGIFARYLGLSRHQK